MDQRTAKRKKKESKKAGPKTSRKRWEKERAQKRMRKMKKEHKNRGRAYHFSMLERIVRVLYCCVYYVDYYDYTTEIYATFLTNGWRLGRCA